MKIKRFNATRIGRVMTGIFLVSVQVHALEEPVRRVISIVFF